MSSVRIAASGVCASADGGQVARASNPAQNAFVVFFMYHLLFLVDQTLRYHQTALWQAHCSRMGRSEVIWKGSGSSNRFLKPVNFMATQRLYEFGPFRLDSKSCVLLRDGAVVPLNPKAFDTLRALVENHGSPVGKDELMKLVWPGTFVEETNLTQQ